MLQLTFLDSIFATRRYQLVPQTYRQQYLEVGILAYYSTGHILTFFPGPPLRLFRAPKSGKACVMFSGLPRGSHRATIHSTHTLNPPFLVSGSLFIILHGLGQLKMQQKFF